MITYHSLGLVNTKKILAEAKASGYAIPGYNFNTLEQLQAIVAACAETRSPVILQISSSALKYIGAGWLKFLAQGAAAMMKKIPIALHLDHGADFAACRFCIDNGFSSVMIDGSVLPYEENITLTKKVVQYAHQRKVTVEGELGILAGAEDKVAAKKGRYTNPEQAEDFARRAGVDSLAIAIGTSHGVHKFSKNIKPNLRLDILKDIAKRLPRMPLVLHGASSIPSNYVAMIKKYGGDLGDAAGIPEKQLAAAVRLGISKINVDSDSRVAVTAIIRKILSEDKKVFDPRRYLGPAREALKEMYIKKNQKIFGCAGKG